MDQHPPQIYWFALCVFLPVITIFVGDLIIYFIDKRNRYD
jgi:hypothetical protein